MEANAIYAKFLSDEPRGTRRAGQLAPDQAAGFPPEEARIRGLAEYYKSGEVLAV